MVVHMKHTKYLSLLLTLFLTFQMFPGNALAADNNVIASDNAIVSPVISDAELDNPSSVRGLTAQQALSGPSDIDFDGEALLLYELNSGTLAYAKNIDEQREPASLTKIMTCLLALERGTLIRYDHSHRIRIGRHGPRRKRCRSFGRRNLHAGGIALLSHGQICQ